MSRRGGGGGVPDHQARYNIGALEQRVYGLEQGVAGLSSQISGLSQQIAASGKTNWSVIIGFGGIALSFMIAIGGMAYWPIREAQADLKTTVAELSKGSALALAESNKTIAALANQTAMQFSAVGDKFVTIRELDARGNRTRQDVDRLNTDMNALDLNMRRAMEQGDANLQRQIDDQKKAFGDTFSLRDALQNMQRRIDWLEGRSRTGPS